MPADEDVTAILQRAGRGDPAALDRLLPLVYEQLHAMAAGAFRGQAPGHTLQPTALVSEAYLRLAGGGTYEDRNHFFAVAARAMRQVLVNHARDRGRLKRGGGGLRRVSLSEAPGDETALAPDLLDLHEALEHLETLNERQARIAELRYFAGLTVEQTAAVLGVSARTVKLDWKMARAFLRGRLAGGDEE